MINRIEANLGSIICHHIGNKAEDEDIKLSHKTLEVSDTDIANLFLKYFVDNFKDPEFYQFTFSNDELALNPIYNYVSNIFDNESELLEESVKIARFLYENSIHPNIKSGDLIIAKIDNIIVDDELVNAIAIFKSETKDTFLKLDRNSGNYEINVEDGVNINKLDKACLIFETERESGFKMCIKDNANFNKEARYWKDDFLNVKAYSNQYHATTQYISLTKSFIKERLPHESGNPQLDAADILHKTKNYLQSNDTFDKEEYEEKVFATAKNLKSAFNDYAKDFEQERNIELSDGFEISDAAVQRKNRVFKSVIKLDKNFHIYVHGDRKKIERIEDADGNKYYKLHFDTES